MNVALISREYPPFFGGGIGTYTVRWSRALAAAGHRVVVITVSGEGREERDTDGDVVVVRLPFIRGIAHSGDWSGPHPTIADARTSAAFAAFSPVSVFSMQIAAALPRLVREFAIDVVEAPDTGALGWFPLLEHRAKGGPPLVVCLHSPTPWIAELNGTSLVGRRDTELVWMERDAIEWADGLVSPSRMMAEWVRHKWGARAVEVIPYPLGELEPAAKAAAAGKATQSDRSIVFAGRLEPRKGIRVLLEGFAQAIERGADLSLELIGEDMPEGGSRHGERLIAALPERVRARIRAHGRLPWEDVDWWRRRALAVAVPSPSDNFPNTCMEAMSLGKPVLAAAAGGMAEMIRDGIDGLLFAPENGVACGKSLQRLAAMSAEHQGELGRAAAARMLDLCGNDRVVGRRVAHFQQVLGAQSAAARADVEYTVLGGRQRDGRELIGAAARMGADFAHGWVEDPLGRVRVYSTPRPETLALSPGDLGPVAVRVDLAKGLPRRAGGREVVLRLLELGHRGVAVPWVCNAERPPGGRMRRLFRAIASRLND